MDCVYSISQPPILGGFVGMWGKWIRHAKYVITFRILIWSRLMLWNIQEQIDSEYHHKV